MPSPIPYHDFVRKFKKYGVEIQKPNKSSHFKMRMEIDGIVHTYQAVVHNKKIDFPYLQGARRRFRLTPEDGVSDQEFKKA